MQYSNYLMMAPLKEPLSIMNKKNSSLFFFLLLFIFNCLHLNAQKPVVEVLTSGTKTSLRGLSVVSDKIIWVSGSKGTVGKSTDGGITWEWITVKGFEKTDFRDIEAFDNNTAIIMGVAEPAYILKTTNGGESWKIVYQNSAKGMFLDAMEFWNTNAGVVIGDPIDGKFFIIRTFDKGNTWQEIPFENRPVADSGEAFFAASGTNIRVLDRDEAVFVSGGVSSKLYSKKEPVVLPIIQGKETTGANSIAVWDTDKLKGGNRMVIVGGDFNADTLSHNNCFYTTNKGKDWVKPSTPPHGYRSCVEYYSKTKLISCGLTGVDYSANGGNDWLWISKESFHVCRKAKSGDTIYLAGNNGKIGKISWK